MKYFRIFLLSSQEAFVQRARSFVWFLIPLVEASLLLLFWIGALKTNTITGVSVSSITSYYLLLAVLSVIVTSHVEEEIAREQIREGGLTSFLIKPISYYWMMFLEEIPYRLLQGFYGLIVLGVLFLFLGSFIILVSRPLEIFLSVCIAIGAYFLFFTYKMIIGILAFWIVDINGIFQLQEIVVVVCAGYILPLSLYPSVFQNILHILPFAYMIYYPILAFQGNLNIPQLLSVLFIQFLWLGVLLIVYKVLWHNGLKRYTATGQ